MKIFKKIKNWGLKLSIKLKSLNTKNAVILALLISLVPLFTHALIGTGIFDFFSSSLEGVSEITLPLTTFFIFLTVGLLLSGLVMQLSIWLLKIAADPANLEIMNSEMVQVGWQFTSSLANTAIIIALIVIGIATILNKESYGAKKTLPKLIIVALLVNFSLVFVGMIVDVANIILMTFFKSDIGVQLTEAIFQSWDSLWIKIIAYLGGLAASFIIPFTAPMAQFAFISATTGLFLPTIISTVMQILIGMFIGGVLLVYAALFLARIFIIQILAILSPLAFVSWAMPKTKKFWSQWLNALVGWSFLGAVLFFFLLLSSLATAPLRPENPPATIFNLKGLSSIFIYYIILGGFLIVAVIKTKDFMPEGAEAMIGQMQQAATGFKKQVSKRVEPIQQRLSAKRDGAVAEGLTDESIQEKQTRYEQASGFEKLRTGFDLQTSKWSRRMSMVEGESPESTVKESQGINKDIIKNASTNELNEMISGKGLLGLRDHEKMPAIEELIGREDFDEVKNTIVNNWEDLSNDLKDKLKQSRPDIHIDLAENVEEGMKNMKEEINGMSGNDVKNIKFKGDYSVDIATEVSKDPSKLQSLGSASYSKKKEFIDSASKIDDPQAEKTLKKYFRNPKNREKWPDALVEENINESSNPNQNTNTQNDSSTIITAEEDRKKRRKERWKKNRENWDNI